MAWIPLLSLWADDRKGGKLPVSVSLQDAIKTNDLNGQVLINKATESTVSPQPATPFIGSRLLNQMPGLAHYLHPLIADEAFFSTTGGTKVFLFIKHNHLLGV